MEGATGLIYNRIDSIAGSPGTDARLTQVPLLMNATFQLPTESRWTPFAGGGCGFAISETDIGHATVQGVDLHGQQTAGAFAYHAFGGVRYSFNRRMDASLGYEFMGTTQPEWDVTSLDSTRTFGTLVLRHPLSHAMVAAFTIWF